MTNTVSFLLWSITQSAHRQTTNRKSISFILLGDRRRVRALRQEQNPFDREFIEYFPMSLCWRLMRKLFTSSFTLFTLFRFIILMQSAVNAAGAAAAAVNGVVR